MKRIDFTLTLWGILFLQFSPAAQQLPLFTQYRETHGMLNPAAVYSDYMINGHTLFFGASVRNQWVGREGAPQTQVLHGEWLSEGNQFSALLGGYVLHDRVGRVSMTGVYARVASILSEDVEWGGFAGGMALGYVQYRIDTRDLDPRDPGDILAETDLVQWKPDVSLGVFAWRDLETGLIDDGDVVYAGLSMPQTFGLDLSFRSDGKDFNLMRVRHMYAQVGYIMNMNEESSFLEGSVWYKYVQNAPMHLDVNIRYQTPFSFWLGSGFGTSGFVHLEAGTYLTADRNLKLGMGYDFNTSNEILAFGNTWEINLSTGFGARYAWR